jgi:hypothetical protein
MRRFKHWAYLNPEGMEIWGDVFPDRTVPVVSMVAGYGPLGSPASPPEYYFKVEWDELTEGQEEEILAILAKMFGVTREEIKGQVAEIGLPLRKALTNGSGTNHSGFFLGGPM